MVPPLSFLLHIAVAATAVNAQLGDFLRNAFGGAMAQNPLSRAAPGAIVAANTLNITSENWRSSVSVTPDATASVDDVHEWMFYFTTQAPNATTMRNVSYWDGVYNDTVYAISTAKPAIKVRFGKVDCSSAAAAELCRIFFLGRALPVFYHLATYPTSNTTEIRRIPLHHNNTATDRQPAFLAKFYAEKAWKDVAPWTGIFNPIDGLLKDYTPILGLAFEYYDLVPQWMFVIGISFFGRALASRFTYGMTAQPERRPEPAANAAS